MSDESVGARGVNEAAEKMGVHKSRVNFLTSSVLRRLRWSNRLQAVKRFLNEYSRKTS